MGQVALLAIDADALQLHLTGVVAGLLGLVVGFEGFIELAPRGQGTAEVEVGQCAFGLAEVVGGLLHVAEEERGDTELEVPALGHRAGGAFDFLFEDLRHVA